MTDDSDFDDPKRLTQIQFDWIDGVLVFASLLVFGAVLAALGLKLVYAGGGTVFFILFLPRLRRRWFGAPKMKARPPPGPLRTLATMMRLFGVLGLCLFLPIYVSAIREPVDGYPQRRVASLRAELERWQQEAKENPRLEVRVRGTQSELEAAERDAAEAPLKRAEREHEMLVYVLVAAGLLGAGVVLKIVVDKRDGWTG